MAAAPALTAAVLAVLVVLVLRMVCYPFALKQKSRFAVGGKNTLQDGNTRYPASRKTATIKAQKKFHVNALGLLAP